MMEGELVQKPTELEEGKIEQYLDRRLFDGKVGTVSGLIRRKKALSNETSYAILYLLYETRVIGRKSLVEATGKDEQGIEHHLNNLLNANLIARIPVPDGFDGRLTFYRITALGQQEIEADLQHLYDTTVANERFGSLQNLGDGKELLEAVNAPIPQVANNSPERMTQVRENIRDKKEGVLTK